MLSTTDLYEMGWNDVLANIRKATEATQDQKDDFCRKIVKGQISFANRSVYYVRGAQAAAQDILDRKAMTFKGPQWVVDDLNTKTS